jgi:hypothetical protein
MDQRYFLEPVIKFKKSLSRAKNDKQVEMSSPKTFRPKGNPLFLNAIKQNADFAAYLIQFAMEYDVDSCLLPNQFLEEIRFMSLLRRETKTGRLPMFCVQLSRWPGTTE